MEEANKTENVDVSKMQGANNSQTQGGATGAGADTKGQSGSEDTKGAGDSNDGKNQDTKEEWKHPETGAEVTPKELVEYYKNQFGASTSGAQKLLGDIKTITSERDTSQATITKLEKDLEIVRKLAEEKNPEGLKTHDLEAQLTLTTQELALIKEDSMLDKFERTTPLAANKRDALKALARANPKESLQNLWDNNLKSGAEAEDAKRKKDDEDRKKGAGDKGKGTSTRESAGEGTTIKGLKGDTGLTSEEFNKLSVNERRDFIVKYDIR